MISLRLLTHLKQGDEFYAQDIIASFVFNLNIWSSYLMNSTGDSNVLIKHFENLRINKTQQSFEFSYTDLNVGKSETIKIDKEFISNLESLHIYENLNQIKLTYLESNYLLNAQLLENSKKLADLNKIKPKTVILMEPDVVMMRQVELYGSLHDVNVVIIRY